MIKGLSDSHFINEVSINPEEHYMVRKCDLIKNLKFVKFKPIIEHEMSMHSDEVFFDFSHVF